MSNIFQNQVLCLLHSRKKHGFLEDNFSSLHLQFPHRAYFALDKPLSKKGLQSKFSDVFETFDVAFSNSKFQSPDISRKLLKHFL